MPITSSSFSTFPSSSPMICTPSPRFFLPCLSLHMCCSFFLPFNVRHSSLLFGPMCQQQRVYSRFCILIALHSFNMLCAVVTMSPCVRAHSFRHYFKYTQTIELASIEASPMALWSVAEHACHGFYCTSTIFSVVVIIMIVLNGKSIV